MKKVGKILGKLGKKHWPWLVVLVLAGVFFMGVASYNFITQADGFTKWASPDETANYVFAKLYGQEGDLRIFEKYNLNVGGMIHPRSFGFANSKLVPVSFLGIILIYGWIVSLTSYKILPFLTPAVGAIGIIFYYLLIKKIFGRRNAMLSAFLLASFPVFIYYSARSMFHNVLFVVLLIMGFYFSMLAIGSVKNKRPFGFAQGRRMMFMALGGGFIGLAIITRTSELLWLGPILLLIWIFNIRKVGITKLIIFLSFLFLAILPNFYWNQILYGSPINSGYPEMNQSIRNITQASTDLVKSTAVGELAFHRELFNKIKDNIFYFGFSARQSVKMFYYYFVKMFWWLFWPAFLGFILFLQQIRKWRKRHFVYILSLALTTLVLVFYYGSWKFHDNPDPNSFTIGNSYTRYWLPIYLGAIPLASLFFLRFTRILCDANPRIPSARDANTVGYLKKFKDKYLRRPDKKFLVWAARAVIVILIYFISINFVLFGSEEGLFYGVGNSKRARQEFAKVLELTESNAVIITRYHDKLFFPERKVIVGLFNDDNMNMRYAQLVDYLPVYYYNFTFPQKDVKYLNQSKLPKAGLRIEKIERVGDFSLYKLTRN